MLSKVAIIASELMSKDTELIQAAVEAIGYTPQVIRSAYKTLGSVRRETPDLFIVRDDFFINRGGWIMADQVRDIAPRLPVIVLKTGPEIETTDSINAGPLATLDMPVNPDDLRTTVEGLIKL
jgi:DNA-binding NtrC family response regulator